MTFLICTLKSTVIFRDEFSCPYQCSFLNSKTQVESRPPWLDSLQKPKLPHGNSKTSLQRARVHETYTCDSIAKESR